SHVRFFKSPSYFQRVPADSNPIIGRINTLPNEALIMILKKIELKKRIPLRILSARMKDLIENICVGQKSLIITTRMKKILSDPRRYASILGYEHDRFLTHHNWKETV